MTAFAFAELRDLMAGRFGAVDAPCPLCGPGRQSGVNQRRKTLRLWCSDPEFISFHCARCEQRGWASATRAARPQARSIDAVKILAEIQRRDNDETWERLSVAMSLWQRRRPIIGSLAETYLREARGYRGQLPATLAYLAPTGEYPPTMISAFGMTTEVAPGEIAIDDAAIRGVHLTSLRPDGSDKAGTGSDKITVGRSLGSPIVLAPVNDLLGLAITEGIENGLSVYDATGLGIWAAGSAGRMPALAERIPGFVECVTVFADPDDTGRANAEKLVAAIPSDNREIRLIVPPQDRSAAA